MKPRPNLPVTANTKWVGRRGGSWYNMGVVNPALIQSYQITRGDNTMRPMGMTRDEYYDDDVNGCTTNGRASGVYNLKGKGGDTRAYHSLRGGKKDAVRRFAKRRARREGRDECRDGGSDG